MYKYDSWAHWLGHFVVIVIFGGLVVAMIYLLDHISGKGPPMGPYGIYWYLLLGFMIGACDVPWAKKDE